MLETVRQDLRFAARTLSKSRGFTAVAVLSLALGIGANATIFTWVKAVLLDPLPGVRDAGSLVLLNSTSPSEPNMSLSYPDYVDLRDRTGDFFDGVIATESQAVIVGRAGRQDRAWAMLVTGNYFDVLGVRPARGRLLSPADDVTPGAHPVVVISHAFWQRAFGGDPGVVGRTVTLNTKPWTVIGVTPPAFQGSDIGLAYDAWAPMTMQQAIEPGGDRLSGRGNHWLAGLARLKPGRSLPEAQAGLAVLAKQIEAANPEAKDNGFAASGLFDSPRGSGRILAPVVQVLAGVVAFVLLIACANLANLLLARGASRQHEIGIRLSLGATRGRIVRQLLTEAVLLSLLGGAVGVTLAFGGGRLLMAFAPPTDLPITLGTEVDLRVLAFTLALSVATGILFGLAPALQTARADAGPTVREEGRTAGSRGGRRLRAALVTSQVALSLVLLAGAGLFTRSLAHLGSADPGFRGEGVLLASIDLFTAGYDADKGRAVVSEALTRLRALPGVEDATVARRVPLALGGTSSTTIAVEGYTPPPSQPAYGHFNQVGPDYFRTLGARLTEGRDLLATDTKGAPLAAVINETMARRYWPEGRALGGRFRSGEDWITVVGVVKDMKLRSMTERPLAQFYLPILQWYRPELTFHARARGDLQPLATAVRQALHDVDPNLAPFGLRTLAGVVAGSAFQQRTAGRMLALFGALGLALAAVGLYGVLAYVVTQRTREIGVRMALGGSRGAIFSLVFRQGMRLALYGIVVGVAGGLALSRPIGSLLVGVRPTDPTTFAAVAAVLALVAGLACAAPSWRAMRLDPAKALRDQ